MNLFTKLAIFFCLKNGSYSKSVDKFIKSVIEEGKFVEHDKIFAAVEYKGKIYHFWIENRWYADLEDCYERGRGIGAPVYRGLRPSRFTQIRFWEWLEKHDPDLFLSPREKAVRNLEAIMRGDK